MSRAAIGAAVLTAAALLCSHATFAELPAFGVPATDEMRAHYIDVGQGAAVLLEFSCAVALIDTGGEKNPEFNSDLALKAYLDAFFARRPDLDRTIRLLVLTHAHADHTGGVKMILNNYTVKFLVDNGRENRDQKLAHSKARGMFPKLKWQAVAERAILSPAGFTSDIIDPITCAGTDPRIRVLWGSLNEDDWGATIAGNPNASSVVTRLDFGAASFLFPGDLEDSVHDELIDFYSQDCVFGDPATCSLDVDVYHAAHHGSHNGTSDELMHAMRPKIAVISVGDGERKFPRSAWNHGHPRDHALRALTADSDGVSFARVNVTAMVANRGSAGRRSRTPQFSAISLDDAVYATSWDGTVVITARADGSLHVDAEK